jgi:outer membrane murein-binding lipoprotein Lpp
MWRRKRWLVVAVVAAVLVLAGTISGVALAADDTDTNQPAAQSEELWNRVAEIYQEKTGTTLDLQALKDALAQVRSEQQTQALQDRLQELVQQDKITQEQADELLEWWQARPDVMDGFGFKGTGFGGMRGWCGPRLMQNGI